MGVSSWEVERLESKEGLAVALQRRLDDFYRTFSGMKVNEAYKFLLSFIYCFRKIMLGAVNEG